MSLSASADETVIPVGLKVIVGQAAELHRFHPATTGIKQ
jgi:hypothetical protein